MDLTTIDRGDIDLSPLRAACEHWEIHERTMPDETRRRIVDAELVVSQRGQGGGLRLARKAAEISMADVLNAIDPAGIKFNLCMLDKSECGRSKLCEISQKFEVLQTELDEKLRSITFDTF